MVELFIFGIIGWFIIALDDYIANEVMDNED